MDQHSEDIVEYYTFPYSEGARLDAQPQARLERTRILVSLSERIG